MSHYIYTCACCGTSWDRTSSCRKPTKLELASMVCQPCRMATKRIAALEAEAQRWRDAHDKIIDYAADVEARAKESIAEVKAHMGKRDKDYIDLCKYTHEEQKVAWNLSRQLQQEVMQREALEAENAALREDKARLVEALEEIADGDGCNCRVGPGCDWKCKDIARNALAKKARAKK